MLLYRLRLCTQALARPDEDEVMETAKETAAKLQELVDKKIASVQPSTLPNQPGAAQYIKYTPSARTQATNSGAQSRIIKMQDMPIDPLEPPKFRHTKVPADGFCMAMLPAIHCGGPNYAPW